MKSLLGKTVSHGSIYALGDLLRNITSFIMLPIYTTFLTPADYGVLELLSMLLDFISIVLGMRIAQAVFRYYSDTDDVETKKQVISTALILTFLLNGIGVALVLLFNDSVSWMMFGNYEYSRFISFFIFVLVLQAIIEVGLIYIRAIQKPWLFIGISLLRLLLQLSLNIYFLVYENLRVEGVIYSALIANSIIAFIILVYVITKNGIKFSRSLAKDISLFSFPLIVASLGSFYLTFGDRYFLRIYSGMDEVGIYSLGYKFGFVLLMLTWMPFEKIWDTQRYDIYRNPEVDSVKTFGRYFFYISSFIIFVGLGIALFVKELFIIMSSPSFIEAYLVVPVILIAYLLQSWTNYCGFGLLLEKKTKHFSYASMFSVFIISIAYLTLIPMLGAMGAALATLVGFFARLVWVNYFARRYFDMKLPWKQTLSVLAIAIGVYSIGLLLPDSLWISIPSKIVLVLIFITLFLILPFLTKEEKDSMKNFVNGYMPLFRTN